MIALAVISAIGAIGGLAYLLYSPDSWVAGLLMLVGFGGVTIYAITTAVRRRGETSKPPDK